MSQNLRVITSLAVGLILGIVGSRTGLPAMSALQAGAEVVGALWLNAIRMTVVPLVVSLLITGVASIGDPARVGKATLRMAGVLLALLTGAAVVASLSSLVFYRWMPRVSDPPAVAADALAGARALSFSDWLVSIVPTNAIKAGADGAMLPLIVFSLAFAIALVKLDASRRDAVVQLLRTIGDCMLVILGWILAIAPLGVFALSFAVGAKGGTSVAGALGFYVVWFSATLLVVLATLYPVTAAFARVPIREFARAILPVQTIAFSSRSSLASLPVMIECGEIRLGFTRATSGFALPLAVSIFRLSAPVSFVTAGVFVSAFYGIALGPAQLATLFALAVLLSFSVPGIPNASLLIMVPVFQSLGLPAEAVGLLIAVDTIPDLFKTVLNASGHMTAAAIVAGPPTSSSRAATL